MARRDRVYTREFETWAELTAYLSGNTNLRPPPRRKRKGWQQLSEAYRKRLIRAGITPRQYAAGKSLVGARGHRTSTVPKAKAMRRMYRNRNVLVMFMVEFPPGQGTGSASFEEALDDHVDTVGDHFGSHYEEGSPDIRSMSMMNPLWLAWQEALEYRQRGYVRKALPRASRYIIKSWNRPII